DLVAPNDRASHPSIPPRVPVLIIETFALGLQRPSIAGPGEHPIPGGWSKQTLVHPLFPDGEGSRGVGSCLLPAPNTAPWQTRDDVRPRGRADLGTSPQRDGAGRTARTDGIPRARPGPLTLGSKPTR